MTYTLIADGRSDRCLMAPIDWCLRRAGARVEQAQWADLGVLRDPPKSLTDRIRAAVEIYPCDVLFIHRDAENGGLIRRVHEIDSIAEGLTVRRVPVVPVRMTEAWLLHDEAAIRSASGNPRGLTPLHLPTPSRVETHPDPKSALFEALISSAEVRGRRLETFKRNLPRLRARVAELIEDWEPLLVCEAFRSLLQATTAAVESR